MSTSYERDQQWFTLHPTTYQYHRPPRPQEWPELVVPPQAVVTVHYINAHCTVRVLALPQGRRLATVIDTDPARVVPLSMPSRVVPVRPPRSMWEWLA